MDTPNTSFASTERTPIQVLVVTPGLIRGGVETHVLLLIRAFAGSNVRIQLATLYDGWLAAEASRLGVRTHILKKRFRGDPRTIFRLATIIKREGIDIVHTHMVGGNLYGRLAGRLAGVRGIVSTLHYGSPLGVAPLDEDWSHALVLKLDYMMGRMSNVLIATSDAVRQHLMAGGVASQRVVAIRNAIDVDRMQNGVSGRMEVRREFGLSDEIPLVGTTGRLVPVKRFDLFLRAARRVAACRPDAVFMIVGDGALRPELEAQAAGLGLAGRVIFAGFREDMARVLAALDLVVMCSDSETTPYAVSEAMAMGKPVVATAVGGVPEQIESGREGLLCPPNDEEKLAEAVIRLLADPRLREEMGRNARRKAQEEFSLAAMARRLRGLYMDILEKKR